MLHESAFRNKDMKSFIQKLTTSAVAAFTLAAAVPTARAANVTLDGYGYYTLNTRVTYYGSAPNQSGRYNTLGSDYYHGLSYKMDFITNHSNHASGSLSYEFWAMRYYNSTSGIIIMTRGLNAFPAHFSSKSVFVKGQGIYLDRRRFPEINLWEYTRYGWKFRDALTFSRKVYL